MTPMFLLAVLTGCTGSDTPEATDTGTPTPEVPADTDSTGTPVDTDTDPERTGDTADTGGPSTTDTTDTGTVTEGLADLTLERCLDDDGCDLPAILDLAQATCEDAVRTVGGTGVGAVSVWTEDGGFSFGGRSEFRWACVSTELSGQAQCDQICPAAGFTDASWVPNDRCVCAEAQPAVGLAADDIRAPVCYGPADDADLLVGADDFGRANVQISCENGSELISEENCVTARGRANLQLGTSLTNVTVLGQLCVLN